VSVLSRLAPLLVLAAALALSHSGIFRAGARDVVPYQSAHDRAIDTMGVADVTYESWLAARHARAWPTPWRLFDTPHCAPSEHTLTLGPPMLSLGLLGVPFAFFTREPLLVYNLELVARSALPALTYSGCRARATTPTPGYPKNATRV